MQFSSGSFKGLGRDLNIRRGVSGKNLILGHLSNKEGVSVFDTFDLRHRRRTILKVQEPTESFQAIERFRREAIALSLIDHPAVVSLYEYSDVEPRVMSLERIDADTVADRVAVRGALSIDAVCRLVEDIGAALDCSHGHGVLHRDVRPENILLTKNGQARLIDFGLAKIMGEPHITFMGQVLRDHAYVSPEQLRGERQLDARADVYSLAAVAYFSLTGQAPADPYVSPRSLRPELPVEIDTVIEAGMAKNVGQRYHTAGQFAAALRIALEACRGKYRTRSWFVPRWSWLTAAVCAAVICGIAIWLVYAQNANAANPKHAAAHVKPLSVAETETLFLLSLQRHNPVDAVAPHRVH